MTLIIIGLLLGIRHAFEPDHLAAVSTLATRPGSHLWSAARLGLVWGVGHTVTVGVLAFLLVGLGLHLPASLWPAGELVVAGLLILLGGLVIWRYVRGRWHMHIHTHGVTQLGAHLHLHSHAKDLSHEHLHDRVDARRSLGFGVAHGLAGSGAIAALLVAAAPDASARIAYFEIGRAHSELQSQSNLVCRLLLEKKPQPPAGRRRLLRPTDLQLLPKDRQRLLPR